MSVANEFHKALDVGMAELSNDEWAISKVRDCALTGMMPSQAFDSISGILKLAGQQSYEYAFASCCWFAMDLARLSETTEPPPGVVDVLISGSMPFCVELAGRSDIV